MTFGEKIKAERKKKKMTQADLAGDTVTRNMISLIEKDAANPSLSTLKAIADRLGVPLSYLVSDGDDDQFFYAKKELIDGIRAAYSAKNYSVTIMRVEKLGETDDELAMILADCHMNIGKSSLRDGSLVTAIKHLTAALEYCDKTVYDTGRIKTLSKLYTSVAENIQAPLLELDQTAYLSALTDEYDFEFFKYLTLDFDFAFNDPVYSKHLEAKRLMKEKDYTTAAAILSEIETTKRSGKYNAYAIFSIYSDLELCYKNLFDFENAYKYSSKRFSLLEGFKT